MDHQTATRISTILRKAADAIDQALSGNVTPATYTSGRGLKRLSLAQVKVPASLNECRDALDTWIEYCWQRDGKLNPMTIEAQIIDLSRMGGPDIVREAVQESMRLGLRAPIMPRAQQAAAATEPPKKKHGGISQELMQRFLSEGDQ